MKEFVGETLVAIDDCKFEIKKGEEINIKGMKFIVMADGDEIYLQEKNGDFVTSIDKEEVGVLFEVCQRTPISV